METQGIALVAAAFAALAAGFAFAIALGGEVADRLRSGRAAARARAKGGVLDRLLTSGVVLLEPMTLLLLRLGFVRDYALEVERAVRIRGRITFPEALTSVLVAVLMVSGALSFAISLSWACAFAVCVCEVLLLGAWSAKCRDAQRERLREALPEALQSMKACFQVGYSLPQTISEVKASTSGPLRDVFCEVEGVLETGGGIDEALAVLKERGQEPELTFLAAALEIQHRTGGSMLQVLEAARQSIADEIALKRTLRTQTAQAKLSAQIVTVMPFALIGVFSLVSPGFLSPFFESVAGIVMLLVALSMQLAGIAMVRKLLRVEVS